MMYDKMTRNERKSLRLQRRQNDALSAHIFRLLEKIYIKYKSLFDCVM